MAVAGPYIRPSRFMSAVVNPIVRRLGVAPTLIVRGRNSGQRIVVPLGAPLELDGQRYLVSGRGETHWVRNLRAAGRGEFRWHGRTQPFAATEVTGGARDRIVAEYRLALGSGVAPLFREIPDPADHPVFRMDPLDAPPADAATTRTR